MLYIYVSISLDLNRKLQIATFGLFDLNRSEERLEVAGAKSLE